MGESGELYRAINGLRKAAEAGFTGNSYYQAANQITNLIELIVPAEVNAAPSEDAAYDFAAMLAKARKGVESELSGNRYYLAVNKIEELASFVSPPPALARQAASFDELSAASKARVEAAAASLGLVTTRRAVPLHAQSAGSLADGELERRSSEPCLMAELPPPAPEPVAPAAIHPKAAAPATLSEAAQSLGSQAAQSEHGAVQRPAPSTAAHPAAAPALQPSAPAYDNKAASAGQTLADAGDPAAAENPAEAAFYLGSPAPSDVSLEEEAVRADMAAAEARGDAPDRAAGPGIQVKEPDEIKRKQPKTLFKLWLDLAFGRKD